MATRQGRPSLFLTIWSCRLPGVRTLKCLIRAFFVPPGKQLNQKTVHKAGKRQSTYCMFRCTGSENGQAWKTVHQKLES